MVEKNPQQAEERRDYYPQQTEERRDYSLIEVLAKTVAFFLATAKKLLNP